MNSLCTKKPLNKGHLHVDVYKWPDKKNIDPTILATYMTVHLTHKSLKFLETHKTLLALYLGLR